jgi:hypothetical protein
MHLSKVPAGCEHLDLELVSRTLARRYGDIPAAARELKVSIPDLRRLTWSKPKLLDAAQDERDVIIAIAVGRLISALDSDDPGRRQWAAEKILGSYLARDHPLAPARRGRGSNDAPNIQTFKWEGAVGK